MLATPTPAAGAPAPGAPKANWFARVLKGFGFVVLLAVLGAGGWFAHALLNPPPAPAPTVVPPAPVIKITLGRAGEKRVILFRATLLGEPIPSEVLPVAPKATTAYEPVEPVMWAWFLENQPVVTGTTTKEVLLVGGETLVIRPNVPGFLAGPPLGKNRVRKGVGEVLIVGTLEFSAVNVATWADLKIFPTSRNTPKAWLEAGMLQATLPNPRGATYAVWGGRYVPPDAEALLAADSVEGASTPLPQIVELSRRTPMLFYYAEHEGGKRLVAYVPLVFSP